jgi:soluble lytic murein transglycosylase-like protein
MSGFTGAYSTDYLQSVAAQDAVTYGVPPGLFSAVISAESSWNPYAYNSASGATGIAQILPSTAASPGYGLSSPNSGDPISSLSFSAQYLRALYDRAGTWVGALQLYSGASNGATPYPGNATVQQELAAADGVTPISGAASNSTPGNGSNSGGGSGCWICDKVNSMLKSVGFILLGIVIVGVGVWMLAGKQTITLEGAGT